MKKFAIILAADLPNNRDILDIVRSTGRILDGMKIGVSALLEEGVDIVKKVKDIIGDKPILVDLKISDIGFQSSKGWEGTNSKIIKALEGSGATHITVQGFPGPSSIMESVETAKDYGMEVLLLPMMSHPGASLFFSRPLDIGYLKEECAKTGLDGEFPSSGRCEDVTTGILFLGESFNVGGYIGPATRPEDLRRYRSITDKPIWCPGFGRQDRCGRNLEEQLKDWAAIVGPESAAIIGSAIFKASDTVKASEEIVEQRNRLLG